MSRVSSRNNKIENEAIREETLPVEETAQAAEPEERPEKRLEKLMRKALAWRNNAREAQEKLRSIELELRQADTEKRSRFERMREAALQEYRNARGEAVRARNQLLSTLRMLPSRS